jgi:hypothetical protein
MWDVDIQNLTHAACRMSGIDNCNAEMSVCRTGGTARERRPNQNPAEDAALCGLPVTDIIRIHDGGGKDICHLSSDSRRREGT